ncbi:MAG: cell wall hydrolase [Bacillota bacterium]|nr:cell wall hydrolase [Bacillota bacterium]MDW7684434.1 cell wall hydrolase [Bacillota bacterium]
MCKKKMNFALRLIVLVVAVMLVAAPIAEAAPFGSRDLRIGVNGDDVALLQEFLNILGYRDGYIDGVFGPLTHGSLLLFQDENGLQVDGIAGDKTIGLIKELAAEETDGEFAAVMAAAEFNFTAAELDLFARIVHAEAEGESFTGQVAVAATILNRIRSERYPDTMSGVVYQVVSGKYQYSPVLDGRINRPAGESAKRAIQEALAGNDPTGGATGFYNPSKTSNQWVRQQPVVTSIGSHVFFR